MQVPQFSAENSDSPGAPGQVAANGRLSTTLDPPLRVLCRNLCRNPSIPVGVGLCQRVLLGNRSEAAGSDQSRINTAPAYRCGSLGIVRLHIGQGIDTVEVRGSSPLVPTMYLIESAGLVPAVPPRIVPTRHHWSPIAPAFRLPPADARGVVACRSRGW